MSPIERVHGYTEAGMSAADLARSHMRPEKPANRFHRETSRGSASDGETIELLPP